MIQTIVRVVFSFEFIFTLFLFAGRYKGDPRFQWVPFDLTLFFLICSIVISIWILFRQKFYFRKNTLAIIAIYFCLSIYALLTLLWSPSHVYGFEKALHLFTLIFWAFAGATLIIAQDRERVKRFFISIFLLSFWMLMESVLFLGENESAFLNVLGGNYLGVGRILSLGVILISVFILMRKNNKKTTIFGLFLLTAYLYVMFVSGGRGPLVSLVPLLILLAYVSFNKQGGQLALTKKFIPSALAVFLAVIAIINLLNSDKVPQGLKRFLLLFEGNSMGDSADTRLYFYAQSFELWKESFFFGNGIGSWPVMMGIGDKRGYPHNIFYEVGAELGVIGLAVLVILIYMSIHMLFTNFKQDIYKVAILMLFLSTFINTMVSGDLSDNRFLFTTLGLMCYQNSFKQTTNVLNNRLLEERGLNN